MFQIEKFQLVNEIFQGVVCAGQLLREWKLNLKLFRSEICYRSSLTVWRSQTPDCNPINLLWNLFDLCCRICEIPSTLLVYFIVE